MIASRRKLSADCSQKLGEIEDEQKKIENERDENVLRKFTKIKLFYILIKIDFSILVQQKEIRDVGLRLRSSQTGRFLPAAVRHSHAK